MPEFEWQEGSASPPNWRGGGAPSPDPRRGSRRARGRRKGRRRVVVILLLLLILVAAGGVANSVRNYLAPGEVGSAVIVTIPEGSTLSEIGLILERAGVVKHASRFVSAVERDNAGTKIKAGVYELRVNEPYESLIAALIKGGSSALAKVTIPEGSTVKQAAELVGAATTSIRPSDYVAAATTNPPRCTLEGYPRGASLEGVLFPARYDLPKGITARALVEQQLASFNAAFAKVDLARARRAKLTQYDVVIIASMVEREARVAEERPLVAAVIWNRLRERMPLQIDATIQYALGETKPQLTYEDLKIDSPYNTYKHYGLPPGPIASPGIAALKAAASPSQVDYLYYVARNDGTGRHYFSTSYKQFLADKAKAGKNGQ